MHSSNLLIQYAARNAHRIGNEFLCDIYDLNIMLYYKNGQCACTKSETIGPSNSALLTYGSDFPGFQSESSSSQSQKRYGSNWDFSACIAWSASQNYGHKSSWIYFPSPDGDQNARSWFYNNIYNLLFNRSILTSADIVRIFIIRITIINNNNNNNKKW